MVLWTKGLGMSYAFYLVAVLSDTVISIWTRTVIRSTVWVRPTGKLFVQPVKELFNIGHLIKRRFIE
ncbi:MAG: hypothetical protein JWQ69_5612 [Pseudomonas sp.]|nr:hypothetical protein [Pseudomonas sp.]